MIYHMQVENSGHVNGLEGSAVRTRVIMSHAVIVVPLHVTCTNVVKTAIEVFKEHVSSFFIIFLLISTCPR